jgi:3'(2'), 5'-bisphosphate nucleotidase
MPKPTAILDDIALARRLAREAGILLMNLRDGGAHEGRALGDAGDHQANVFLLKALADGCPDDAVLSEESVDDGKRFTAERVWIIDPLDGTREYREGRDDWAVHVALVARGEVIAAAVAQPTRDEVFDSTKVALTRDPQKVIVVSRSRPPAFSEDIARVLEARVEAVGSAGAKALVVVRGDALAYIHEGGLNEWDAAAPVGVALAHGLHVSDLQGRPIVFNQRDVVLHGGLVLCRPECAAAILRITKTVAL